MDREAAHELGRQLREAGGAELEALVRGRLAEIGPPEACLALRNPFADASLIELLVAGAPALLRAYEFRRELALHPRTPELISLRLVPGLYWLDLVRLGLDVRIRPLVRRAADLRLIERLSVLSVGERIALARQAGAAVLAQVRRDPTPRVIAAMLENPRLTEGLLLPLLAGDEVSAPVLALVAANSRFGSRYPVRLAVAKNPRTPAAVAMGLLPGLRKSDLGAVGADPRLAWPVRQRARLLLGETRRAD
jgi:hypothetical protein